VTGINKVSDDAKEPKKQIKNVINHDAAKERKKKHSKDSDKKSLEQNITDVAKNPTISKNKSKPISNLQTNSISHKDKVSILSYNCICIIIFLQNNLTKLQCCYSL
jgi:hypothetical protein